MIECLTNTSAAEFLEINEAHLLKHESRNNLLLGLTDLIIRGARSEPNTRFFTLSQDGEVVGQAMSSESKRSIILSELSAEALAVLINTLVELSREREISLSGVVGPSATSIAFYERWRALHEVEIASQLRQGIYELSEVIHPDYEGGELIIAEPEHRSVIAGFIQGFMRDCFPHQTHTWSELEERADAYIQNRAVSLWRSASGEWVSMAAKNRESKNAATVSLVYTPPHLRGRGHARRVVAALSQRLLDGGKTKCNLFTDLSNPTSNRVYQEVGYQMIGEGMHFRFK